MISVLDIEIRLRGLSKGLEEGKGNQLEIGNTLPLPSMYPHVLLVATMIVVPSSRFTTRILGAAVIWGGAK